MAALPVLLGGRGEWGARHQMGIRWWAKMFLNTDLMACGDVSFLVYIEFNNINQ